jgi:DNA-binding Lrp family transcriptional regulator
MDLDSLDRRLLNNYQRDFPIEPRPFAPIAAALGISEAEVLYRFWRMKERGILGRIGTVVRPNTIGASTLAAMAVPVARLDEVAALVSAQSEVNHNYEREHRLNLWFVVTAEDRAAVERVLTRIREMTELPVIDLPLERSFHIDLGFDLT